MPKMFCLMEEYADESLNGMGLVLIGPSNLNILPKERMSVASHRNSINSNKPKILFINLMSWSQTLSQIHTHLRVANSGLGWANGGPVQWGIEFVYYRNKWLQFLILPLKRKKPLCLLLARKKLRVFRVEMRPARMGGINGLITNLSTCKINMAGQVPG